ncbi:hypothetical protein D3C79_874460 [compost metagenome]
MVSDKVKKIVEIYQSKTLYRPCAVGHLEQNQMEVYWLIQPRVIDCLHETTTYHMDGSLKDLVLCKEKVGMNKVFKVDCARGDYWILDLEVLERLYREGITAFHVLPVKAM